MAVTPKEREAIRQELLEEIRAAQREYKRRWRAKNAHKQAEYNERFFLKKVAEYEAARVKAMGGFTE